MRISKKKIAAWGLTTVLAAGLLAGNVEFATHTFAIAKEAAREVTAVSGRVVDYAAAKKAASRVEKSESVYVTMDANGNKKDVLVSDWLKGAGLNGTLEDVSNLTDIQNTKGEEKFSQEGDKLTWEAADQDIYYQGKTQEELPVKVAITYTLDGEEIAPQDLLGKSGKLEMKIQYQNFSKKKMEIAGEKKEVYTPFLMATGMILPVEHFTNVKVDNGEVLSEGDNDIVGVYGMPGLKETLDLGRLDFGEDTDIDISEIEDKMTDTAVITADVKEFELGPTYTIATASIFHDINLDDVKDGDELEEKMDELKEAARDLVDGSDKIRDGLDGLDTSFAKYAKAINTLQKSVRKLNGGAKDINAATQKYTKSTDKLLGAVNTYVDGAKTYAKSTKTYAASTKLLVDGVGKLYNGSEKFPASYGEFDTKLNTYITGVTTLLSQENMTAVTQGASALQKGIKTINEGAAALNSKKADVDTAIAGLEALADNYKKLAATETDATKKATYEQMAAQMEAAVAGTKQYVQGAQELAASVDIATNGKADGELDEKGSKDLAMGMDSLNTSLETVAANAKTLRENAPALLSASKTVDESIDSICTNLKEIYKNGQLLTGNNKKINESANSLITNAGKVKKNSKKLTASSRSFRKGSRTLKRGTAKLLIGVNTLTDKTGDVSDGIGKLAEGSVDLYDGMSEFRKEGVTKLTDAVDNLLGGAGDLKESVEALGEAARDYKSFTGISSHMDGKVKFIMTTEEIKGEE